MNEDPFVAVPPEQRDVARAAVASALGPAGVGTLRPILGGASALAYRVETDQRSFLLRMESSHGAPRSAEHYACMQMAADAGIAPALRYLDAERGVAIMDFVPQRPLQEYPGGAPGLCAGLGGLVRQLQASTAFPAPRLSYLDLVGRMLGAVHGSRVFTQGLLDPHLAGFQRIREAYPWDDSTHVSSHNDPNPRNVLFDGERLWLIDWETSGRNDPFADVAVLSHELAGTPELQDALLRNALGCEPDRAARARLQLMRQVTRLYIACVILRGFASRPQPDPDLAAPTPAEFVSAIRDGRLRIGTPELLYTWGKMFLAAYLAGLGAPDFETAVAEAR